MSEEAQIMTECEGTIHAIQNLKLRVREFGVTKLSLPRQVGYGDNRDVEEILNTLAGKIRSDAQDKIEALKSISIGDPITYSRAHGHGPMTEKLLRVTAKFIDVGNRPDSLENNYAFTRFYRFTVDDKRIERAGESKNDGYGNHETISRVTLLRVNNCFDKRGKTK